MLQQNQAQQQVQQPMQQPEIKIGSLVDAAKSKMNQSSANSTPSPLQELPQSMTVKDMMYNQFAITGDASTLPKEMTLGQMQSAYSLYKSANHPGYSGSITNQGTQAGGNLPEGYDPKQNYNNFYAGQCTSYASWYWSNVLGKKFVDINGQGNAKQWPELAKEQGYTVSDKPQVGDIVSWPDVGTYGHVAIVQGVNPDGTINVSEMNYSPGKYTTRSGVSSQGAQFIH